VLSAPSGKERPSNVLFAAGRASGEGTWRQARAPYSVAVREPDAPATRNHRNGAALAIACISLVLSLVACGVVAFVVPSNCFDVLPVQSVPEVPAPLRWRPSLT
jgi:hypothetical protein